MTTGRAHAAQLLVHFLDGAMQACTQETAWAPFAHDNENLEWCEASSSDVACLIVVRLRGEPSPVLGAEVNAVTPLTERGACRLVDEHGGRDALRPPPSIPPLRRMSERPKEQPWFRALAERGFITDKDVTSFLSQIYHVPTVDLDAYEVDFEVVMLLTKAQCEAARAVPVAVAGGTLVVAMADPTNAAALRGLTAATGRRIEPVIASDEQISVAITRYYG